MKRSPFSYSPFQSLKIAPQRNLKSIFEPEVWQASSSTLYNKSLEFTELSRASIIDYLLVCSHTSGECPNKNKYIRCPPTINFYLIQVFNGSDCQEYTG
jgi:hypothetical protein